jgi:hypothetical protein
MAASTDSARITLSTGRNTSVRASSAAWVDVGQHRRPDEVSLLVAVDGGFASVHHRAWRPPATPCAMSDSMRAWLSA